MSSFYERPTVLINAGGQVFRETAPGLASLFFEYHRAFAPNDAWHLEGVTQPVNKLMYRTDILSSGPVTTAPN